MKKTLLLASALATIAGAALVPVAHAAPNPDAIAVLPACPSLEQLAAVDPKAGVGLIDYSPEHRDCQLEAAQRHGVLLVTHRLADVPDLLEAGAQGHLMVVGPAITAATAMELLGDAMASDPTYDDEEDLQLSTARRTVKQFAPEYGWRRY